MQYRTLGKTGLKVSLMSYGTGGPSKFGQATGLDDAGRRKLIRRALDLGINLFDTAEAYGESEELLGRALEGVSRGSYHLATKWGPGRGANVKSDPAEMAASIERSLRRLNTDFIEVMQFHGLDAGNYAKVVERFYPALERLKQQGKVRFIGFTEMMTLEPKHDTPQAALERDARLWDTVMLKYGILNQWAAKKVLPLALKHKVGVMNMAPVRLTLTRPGDWKSLLAEWKAEGYAPAAELDGDTPFGWLVRDGVESVIAAGYKFAAVPPAISTVITGTASIEHLESNVRAITGSPLPGSDVERLVSLLGDSAAKS